MIPLKFWQTIQFKIIVSLGLIFLCINTFLMIFNFQLYRSELIKTLTNSAINLNESIQSSLEMAMLTGNREQIQHAIERIGHDQHIVELFISDKNGIIRAASDSQVIGQRLDITDRSCQVCHTSQPSRRSQSIIYEALNESRILRTVSPIYNQEACYRCHNPIEKINGVLFLDYSLASYEQRLASYKLRIALLGGVTIFLLAVLTFIFLNKFLIQRVRRLVARLQSIGAGDLKGKIQPSGNDEFSLLASSINQMSQKIAESMHKIKEQRDYLQSVIDNVQDGLIVVDKDFKVMLVNQIFLQFIGKSADTVLGLPCNQSLGNDVCCHVQHNEQCPSAKVFADGKFAHSVHSYHDGHDHRTLEISASPLFNEDGEIIQSIEIIRDVNEKVQLEKELLQSEKMALVGRLAAGIAHEINNPLATISTCTEGLLSRINEPEEKTISNASWMTEYLERIEKCIYRCKDIIERLLGFSRSTKVSSIQTFNLNQVIQETVPMIAHKANQEHKRIITSFSDAPAFIKGDPNQISQLILNMLVNSLDAMTSDDQVVIDTCEVNGNILMNIADTGRGIDKEHIDHIFDPFFTTKEVGKGTGLGLFICQRIVNDHGGKINVESTQGKGCKFEIILPKGD